MFLLMGFASADGNTINAIITTPLNLASTHYNTYLGAVASCVICNAVTVNTVIPYGIVSGIAAGNQIYYPYRVNSIIFVYNVAVAKNQNYLCINLTSALFSQPISAKAHIPCLLL